MSQSVDHSTKSSAPFEPKPVLKTRKLHGTATNSFDINVSLKLEAHDVNRWKLFSNLQEITERLQTQVSNGAHLHDMLESILAEDIRAKLQSEFDDFVCAYRDMLEHRMPTGQDEAISRALTRAKLQTEILSSVPMVDQSQACTLLGLSTTNPSATLKRYEAKDRILRFDIKGKAAYPLFQFNVSEQSVYPVLLKVMKMRTDDWGGKMALLHWLTTFNRSLGDMRPCDCLADKPQMIVDSFEAEITEQLHG